MKILKFCVSGQTISWDNPIDIVAGSEEYLYCEFAFNGDWEGKNKLYKFSAGADVYSGMVDENGLVKVPFEVIKPPHFVISCGGYEGTEFIPTAGIKIKVKENGYGD